MFHHPKYASHIDFTALKSQVNGIWNREIVYDVKLRTRVSAGGSPIISSASSDTLQRPPNSGIFRELHRIGVGGHRDWLYGLR